MRKSLEGVRLRKVNNNNYNNNNNQNQNGFYCQVGFHIQGLFSGVFGANLNIENIGKVEKKTYLQQT